MAGFVTATKKAVNIRDAYNDVGLRQYSSKMQFLKEVDRRTGYRSRKLIICAELPRGRFFVCGPTGSGKTTTLCSVLGHLNCTETKIWTAENPVEITQNGFESDETPFLTMDELESLTIRAGTLTRSERESINHHIVATILMLEQLSWPKHLKNV